MVLRTMHVFRSILAAALVAAVVSPALSAPEPRRKASAVPWASFVAETAPQTGAPKRGKTSKPSTPGLSQDDGGRADPDGTLKSAPRSIKATSRSTSGSTAKSTPKPPPGKITCQLERICQEIKRPVREVVTACTMVKPSPDMAPRRICTEKVANGERGGPQLCRSARICKVRQDVNATR